MEASRASIPARQPHVKQWPITSKQAQKASMLQAFGVQVLRKSGLDSHHSAGCATAKSSPQVARPPASLGNHFDDDGPQL